ncbi:polysaccharide pyruvyl transferase family protein [Klebsiella pneumoniae]|uniref:polysaccharide pyruvyl transferase family protein n=1 Tax=Klebsiella pneumoniae TaxID=573 RepID=UPI001F4C9841|nr:polysaccharide pyruvyl transferase family protein [Klebsiella pneumoniae]MCP6551873.1 polysaccharide pyruvyl transferase family protein [Klebsiella pneumoniae]MCP6580800.1 polysaccharide pyruvyl transferase family protein [Klebsiella pneumoniae]MCP6610536.1 polysaccharide pyruvyl transferase family protein [Klebsiella pneumoniae]MCQ0497386.1 polysaccharide pyruvyl transferase family protein [Klebsiella pneumoniae]MCS6334269.1 polysaccharide pyruvyl transferase family protein [Klebsiella pne
MSKFGVIVYEGGEFEKANLLNLGDYVQSTAAKQFLPRVDEYITREGMHLYNNDTVKMIMNAWYMANPENFPPSKKIDPLYVSLHLNSSIIDKIFRPEVVEHFKAHQPIGCRDNHTRDLLISKGVDAYYSGCMTLTLGNTYKRTEVSNEVIFVDIMHDSLTLKKLLKQPLRLGKRILTGRIKELVVRRNILQKYFDDEVLDNATYIDQMVPYINADEGFKMADEYLKRLAAARFVVTSRIHTALPCLAMGTPVIFVNGGFKTKVDKCRFDGLFDFFNRIDVDGKGESSINFSFNGDKIGMNTELNNKDLHVPFANELIAKCKQFTGIDAKL